MRTQTFIGLILLVIALLVASTPQLLDPTARGVERLGMTVGVLNDPSDDAKRERRDTELVATGDVLMLKGHLREENGDMRDLHVQGSRVNQHNRLTAGEQRVGMPGLPTARDQYHPTVNTADGTATEVDGVLLDFDGCPVFPPGADIAAIVANAEARQLYANKAASADDPASCRAALDASIQAAQSPVGFALPGDRRKLSSSVRSDSERLMFDLYADGMYEDIFSAWLDAPDRAVAIKDDLAGTS